MRTPAPSVDDSCLPGLAWRWGGCVFCTVLLWFLYRIGAEWILWDADFSKQHPEADEVRRYAFRELPGIVLASLLAHLVWPRLCLRESVAGLCFLAIQYLFTLAVFYSLGVILAAMFDGWLGSLYEGFFMMLRLAVKYLVRTWWLALPLAVWNLSWMLKLRKTKIS